MPDGDNENPERPVPVRRKDYLAEQGKDNPSALGALEIDKKLEAVDGALKALYPADGEELSDGDRSDRAELLKLRDTMADLFRQYQEALDESDNLMSGESTGDLYLELASIDSDFSSYFHDVSHATSSSMSIKDMIRMIEGVAYNVKHELENVHEFRRTVERAA